MHAVMLSDLMVKIIQSKDAEDFMSDISPLQHYWESEIGSWLYRGHANTRWLLLPSVLRSKVLLDRHSGKFIFDDESLIGILSEEHALRLTNNEFWYVRQFFEGCDQNGLHIPGDSHEHRTIEGLSDVGRQLGKLIYPSRVAPNWSGEGTWPTMSWSYVFALAQHYGIPTRLMDWTRNPRVAAYFAVRKIAEEVSSGKYNESELESNCICVWSLSKRKLDRYYDAMFPEERDKPPSIRSVTAPQASNPNLRAQAGTFIVDANVRRRIPLDVLILDAVKGMKDQTARNRLVADWPLLIKIELQYKYARKLLRLLAREGITSASIYPGYQGVVAALQERSFWNSAIIATSDS